jgi:hypothetical protein
VLNHGFAMISADGGAGSPSATEKRGFAAQITAR